MTEVGIECPSCGHMAPPGSNRCPTCNSPLRLGGNRTQFFASALDPGQRRGERADAQPTRDAGRFTIALRERHGEYEPGRALECRIVPGEEVVLIARVHNQTRVVDNFDLSVAGLPKEWTSVRPETVYLTPRDAGRGVYEQEVEVRIAPPRSSDAVAGKRTVSVVAVSRATGARQTADLTLSIEPFAKLTAGLRPAELRSRYRARTRLVVRNEGNGAAQVKLAGVDPAEKLRFKFAPEELRIGDEAEARVTVRAPKRIWIGQPRTHRFTVEATGGGDGVSADGTLDHRPYLPPWVLLLVPLIAAAIAWYVQRPEQGTVPVVTNTSLREAARRVTQAGLRPEFQAIQPADQSHPAPRVVDQSPSPGKRIDVDKPVTIIFEQGIGKAAVPGVVTKTVRQARAILEPRFQLGQVLPLDAPPGAKIVAQKPAQGELLPLHGPVSVTVDRGKAITAGAVVAAGGAAAAGAASSATPTPAGKGLLGEPLAYSDGHQIFVKEPGTGAHAVAGDATSDDTHPTWNPADKTIAYVHGLSPTKSEIRVVDPAHPNSDHAITDHANRYGTPAYSPKGTLLAMIEEDGSGFGGRLCLMAADGGKPTCWDDPDFHYYRPAWGDETTLYVLRREKDSHQPSGLTQIARFTAEQPGGTAQDEWTADAKPVVRADVQWMAVGTDDRIAALTRKATVDAYTISLYDAGGTVSATQPPGFALCQLSWSGEDLVAMVDGCSKNSPPPKIEKYDADDLRADPEMVVRMGQDPALAPAR